MFNQIYNNETINYYNSDLYYLYINNFNMVSIIDYNHYNYYNI